MSRRLVVLGHRGMLGHVAARYFRERGCEVATTDARFDPGAPEPFLRDVAALAPDVVVNAIGLVKQRSADPGRLLELNAALPLLLRLSLPPHVTLVQPSTDCVFAGTRGGYRVDERPDAMDAYGLSKALGESVASHPNTLVVRVSIIGLELGGGATGLLGWFLSHGDGAALRGFLDHRWNGLTTLEWCRVVDDALDQAGGANGQLIQPGTERRWTKAEMLHLFADVWSRRVRIDDVPSGAAVDRSLEPTIRVRPLEDQLRELAEWAPVVPSPTRARGS